MGPNLMLLYDFTVLSPSDLFLHNWSHDRLVRNAFLMSSWKSVLLTPKLTSPPPPSFLLALKSFFHPWAPSGEWADVNLKGLSQVNTGVSLKPSIQTSPAIASLRWPCAVWNCRAAVRFPSSACLPFYSVLLFSLLLTSHSIFLLLSQIFNQNYAFMVS